MVPCPWVLRRLLGRDLLGNTDFLYSQGPGWLSLFPLRVDPSGRGPVISLGTSQAPVLVPEDLLLLVLFLLLEHLFPVLSWASMDSPGQVVVAPLSVVPVGLLGTKYLLVVVARLINILFTNLVQFLI